MEKTRTLLSFRHSKTNPLNRVSNKRLAHNGVKVNTSAHEACPICRKTNGTLISEVDRTGFFCDTVVCSYCNLVFNDSFILEPKKYYENYYGTLMWKKDAEENFLNRTAPNAYSWKRLAYVALNMGDDFLKVNSVLEIGCGDGCNLYPYHLHGIMVKGYDYGKEYLEVGCKRGMNLVQGDFSKCDQKYDLILLVHTFHQLFQLDNVVRNIQHLLKDEGRVYVEVPGIRNWNRDQNLFLEEDGFSSSNNFLSYLQYQHNYHFDLNHLMEFWQRNGFEMVNGDEWVRGLFKKGNVEDNISFDYDILSHLQTVEKNYLSPKNLMKKIIRRTLKIIRLY